MDRLSCTIMTYAWGSRSAISSFQGREQSKEPEAELWMGAHPMAPSMLERNGSRVSLADVIERAPETELGAAIAKSYGARLPFLFKVLAAAEPLSLQAHPTMDRAKAGFADEEARGIPRDAPHRNYRDASHKPELLCAITPFEALCGFRRAADTLRLLDDIGLTRLALPLLETALAPLRAAPNKTGIAKTFAALMTLPEGERPAIVAAVSKLCQAYRGAFVREATWAARLNELYPGDIGMVSSLLLNLLELEPGQAIYLDAGNLHAYLDGVGVEIMASSDNVLRGGLTKKHVDVAELMAVLDFTDGPVTPLAARKVDAHEEAYETPAREFRLSRVRVNGTLAREASGPEILLVLDDGVTVSGELMRKSDVVFIPGTTGTYEIAGRGSLYRATTNSGRV